MSETAPMELWSPDDGVRRILVVTAHPDDVDFGVAGSVAAGLAALFGGATILRVHDVPETMQAVRVWQGIFSAPRA